MSWKKFFEAVGGFLGGEATGFVREIKSAASDTFDQAERKIEKLTHKALKAATGFLMIFLGFIFALVGLSKYLAVEFALKDGVGFIVIGVALILLGWFAKAMRN